MPETTIDKFYLLVFALGVLFLVYQVVKRIVEEIIFYFSTLEMEVVSRNYRTRTVEGQSGEEGPAVEEEYTLEVRLPRGRGGTRTFTVDNNLYNSLKEGGLVLKERGRRELIKVEKEKKPKRKKK